MAGQELSAWAGLQLGAQEALSRGEQADQPQLSQGARPAEMPLHGILSIVCPHR